MRCTGNEEVKKKDCRPIKRPERKYDAACGGRNHLHADYYPCLLYTSAYEQALTQSQNSMAKHHEMQRAPEGQAMDMTGM